MVKMAIIIIICGIVDVPFLDFNALKIFIAVVERDSFVGVSSPEMPTSNVSRCISQLEDKLNLQLIERSTRT